MFPDFSPIHTILETLIPLRLLCIFLIIKANYSALTFLQFVFVFPNQEIRKHYIVETLETLIPSPLYCYMIYLFVKIDYSSLLLRLFSFFSVFKKISKHCIMQIFSHSTQYGDFNPFLLIPALIFLKCLLVYIKPHLTTEEINKFYFVETFLVICTMQRLCFISSYHSFSCFCLQNRIIPL